MSIKILSADEIKQKTNSFDIPPVLFANPKNLYQRRAKRLRELAKDHPLADYLLFAADVVESQLSVFEKNPLEKQHFDNLDELEPLNTKTFKRSSIWIEYLKEILHSIKPKANEQVLATIENLEKASDKELEEMASHLLSQEFNLVSTDKAVFIWAAFLFIGYNWLNKFLITVAKKELTIYITALFVVLHQYQVLSISVLHKVYAICTAISVKVSGI